MFDWCYFGHQSDVEILKSVNPKSLTFHPGAINILSLPRWVLRSASISCLIFPLTYFIQMFEAFV